MSAQTACNENRIIRVSGQVWSVSRYSWSQIVFALTPTPSARTSNTYIYINPGINLNKYKGGRSNFWGFRFSVVRYRIFRYTTNNYYY